MKNKFVIITHITEKHTTLPTKLDVNSLAQAY